MKYITALIFAVLFPITAFASQTVPDESLERIPWAIKHSGAMPKSMIVWSVLLIALIIITILMALRKGEHTDE